MCLLLTLTHPVNRTTVLQVAVSKEMDCCKVGGQSIVVTVDNQSLLLRFKTPSGLCTASLDSFRVLEFRRQGYATMASCFSLYLQTWGASSCCWTHAATKSGENVPQKATWRTGTALQRQWPSTTRCSMVSRPKATAVKAVKTSCFGCCHYR